MNHLLGQVQKKRIHPNKAACENVDKVYSLLRNWDCDPCTTSNAIIKEVFESEITDDSMEEPTSLSSVLDEFGSKFGYVKFYDKPACNAQLTCSCWA